MDERAARPAQSGAELRARQAIFYLLNHWTKLALFLSQPGAPLDNNIVERALKKAILNRRNALFYKTPDGAVVGDLFMRSIHTCELNGANPFDYLTELLRHLEQLKQKPSEWMPGNYHDRLTCPVAAQYAGGVQWPKKTLLGQPELDHLDDR